jgi:hypothetical protein
MDPDAIRAKFGTQYIASERTFLMGIDRRFAAKIAERFRNRQILETCTGGGFTTIELARVAAHVFTVEIDPAHQAQAKQNVAMAGLLDRVTFVLRDMLDGTWEALSGIDAAFLDPDWAVTGPDHVHRFRRSSTRPRTASVKRNSVFDGPPIVGACLQSMSGLSAFGSYPHEREVRRSGPRPRVSSASRGCASSHGSEVWLPRCFFQTLY